MEESIYQKQNIETEPINQSNQINFTSLLEILLRRKKIFIFAGIVFFLITSANLFYKRIKKPIYRGSFTIMISDPFTNNRTASDNLANLALNKESLDIPTLVQYLKSPDVISDIARKNNLSPGSLSNGIKINIPRNEGSLGRYLSQTLLISFDGKNRLKIKNILEDLSRQYVIKASESRNEKLSEGIKFLNEEKPRLQAKVREAQRKLETFRLDNKVIDPTQEGSSITSSIEGNKSRMLAVESENVRLSFIKENLVNGILYTEGINSSGSGDGAGLGVIGSDQLLLKEILNVKTQLANAQSKYKKSSNVILNLQAKLNQLEPILLKNQKSAVEAAIIVNNSLIKSYQNQISELQKKFISVPSKVTEYSTIVQNLNTLETNLISLNRAKDKLELDLSQGTLPWKILQAPGVGSSPIKPEVKKGLTYIIIYTFVFASLVTFIIEKLDDVFHNTKEVEKFINLPILGFVPFFNFSKDDDDDHDADEDSFITIKKILKQDQMTKNLKFIFEETFRNIYTSIKFSKTDKEIKIVNITSTIPEEGKSLCSLFLATNISQLQKKVLIIDTDLRKPSLHKRLEVDNVTGISNYLVNNEKDWENYINQHENFKYLSYMTAGKIPPNSISLLESDRMKSLIEELKSSDKYDFIILDCPPLLGLSDALIISNYVDAAILTISLNKVNKKLANGCLEKLKLISKPVIGSIINSVSEEKNKNLFGSNYYTYNNQYGYYSYKYMPIETQNRYLNEDNSISKESFKDLLKENTLMKKTKSILIRIKNWFDE